MHNFEATLFSTQFWGNIVCQHNSGRHCASKHGRYLNTVDTQYKFVRVSLTKYSVHNLGVTLCVNTKEG
jgi:hypothetical protein